MKRCGDGNKLSRSLEKLCNSHTFSSERWCCGLSLPPFHSHVCLLPLHRAPFFWGIVTVVLWRKLCTRCAPGATRAWRRGEGEGRGRTDAPFCMLCVPTRNANAPCVFPRFPCFIALSQCHRGSDLSLCCSLPGPTLRRTVTMEEHTLEVAQRAWSG